MDGLRDCLVSAGITEEELVTMETSRLRQVLNNSTDLDRGQKRMLKRHRRRLRNRLGLRV